MYIGPASIFFLYLDLTLGLCRAAFPMSLVSPIGLPARQACSAQLGKGAARQICSAQ